VSTSTQGVPLRPARPGSDPRVAMERKQRAGAINRALGWIMLPFLIVGTAEYHLIPGEEYDWIATGTQWIYVPIMFVHAALSYYVFGLVRPARTLRVFHIYFGYATFVIVMIAQIAVTIEAPMAHGFLSIAMYVALLGHIVIGLRYYLVRRRALASGASFAPNMR
jgi:hypothetical protein